MPTASLAQYLGTIYSDPDDVAEISSRIRVLIRQGLALAAVEARQTIRCPRCSQDLDRSAFGLAASRPNGLQPYCRPCRSAKARPTVPATSTDL